jgi:phosphoribosyl 1,2-cyclic phosphodiesterase
MKITFWGTRGSIAAPGSETVVYGGNTTCVQLTLSSGRVLVIDAGTGIRPLGDTLLDEGRTDDLILLLTHIHWDHIMGFPFFRPIFEPETRIAVGGCNKALEGLRHAFNTQFLDGTWPLGFDDLKARIEPRIELGEGRTAIDDTVVLSHRLQHPQGGVGFRFFEGARSLVFLTDNELREDGWAGVTFQDFVTFCRGADILVHDCQYLPEEMDTRRGWGHSDAEAAARLAVEAEVGKLILFHHDPWRTDLEVAMMTERCREYVTRLGASLPVQAARESATHAL